MRITHFVFYSLIAGEDLISLLYKSKSFDEDGEEAFGFGDEDFIEEEGNINSCIKYKLDNI